MRLDKAIRLLGRVEATKLAQQATRLDEIELEWMHKFDAFIAENVHSTIQCIHRDTEPHFDIDFGKLLIEHALHVMNYGLHVVRTGMEKDTKHLAKRLPSRLLPTSFADLRKMYDEYRTKKKLPPRLKTFANDLKKEYLGRVKSIWSDFSEAFRSGDAFAQADVVEKIKDAGKVTSSRAKTMVRTETTSYYNQVRKKIYDSSSDITHYMFLAIRDQATTKWCKTRDGLIYKKGEEVTRRETPGVHWSCRSEMVPLTPLNPVHLKLINNKSKWRQFHRPEPLPPGWNAK